MNLRKLLDRARNDGLIVKYEEKGYGNRTYEREKFIEGGKEKLEDEVVSYFKSRGWKSKPRRATGRARRQNPDAKRDGFISRQGKHHTKITWYFSDYWGISSTAKLEKKTPNGGWTVEMYNDSNIDKLIDQALSIPKPSMVSKTNLPASIEIGTGSFIAKNVKANLVYTLNKWRHVRADGAVGLDDKGFIDRQKVYDPKEEPWFLCVVTAHDGSSSYIITDGDILHPVKSHGRLRVTSNVPGLVENTTELDKRLLRMAITALFESE